MDSLQPYMEKLGHLWMKERGLAQPSTTYVVERLPTGYSLYGKKRSNDPKHVDYYMYGHPSGYKFRSVNEFYDHFKCLMDNGNANGCTCVGCSGGRKASKGVKGTPKPSQPLQVKAAGNQINAIRSTGSATATSTPSGSTPLVAHPLPETAKPRKRVPKAPVPRHEMVDEEGTPDIYARYIDELRVDKTVSKPFVQEFSPDWYLGHQSLKDHVKTLMTQPRFVPRIGEVVLFVRSQGQDEGLYFDEGRNIYGICNKTTQAWVRYPKWEAGVITQMPEEPIGLEDLTLQKGKEYGINYSGYRIEPLPEPGAEEKPLSKQYTFVPLHQMRPFVFYKEFLRGVDSSEWQPSVRNAKMMMASFCLVDKFHFKGTWPSATLFCRGIYIGSELLLVGDVVRVMPNSISDPVVTDVMKITAIKLKFVNLKSPEEFYEDDDNTQVCNMCIHVSGQSFTCDPVRAWGMGKVAIDPDSDVLPAGLARYDHWYHSLNPSKHLEIPFSHIVGRCFEDEAMIQWFPPSKAPPPTAFTAVNKAPSKSKQRGDDYRIADINKGLAGLCEAREYSSTHDPRILAEGKSWHWGESRASQLDLYEINGAEVGPMAERDTAACRRAIRLREGHRDPGVLPVPKPVASKPTSAISAAGIGAPKRTFAKSGMVASAMALGQEGDDEDVIMSGTASGTEMLATGKGRKRGLSAVEREDEGSGTEVAGERMKIIDLAADDDSDESDDDEAEADQLVEELAGSARGESPPKKPKMRAEVLID